MSRSNGYLSVFGYTNSSSSSSSSSSGGSTAMSLDNLTDVTQSAAADRQVLAFDNLVWKNKDIEFVCGVTGVTGAIHIGNGAVTGTASLNSVSIGSSSGLTNQGAGNVAVGEQSGKTNQGDRGIALGYYAAQTSQSSDSIAIGQQAGMTTQGLYSLGLGYQAGKTTQDSNSIAIGNQSGVFTQAAHNIAIGTTTQYSGSGNYSIAIGDVSGQLNQGVYATALGTNSGQTNQGEYGVSVGVDAGKTSAGSYSVNVGASSGEQSVATGTVNVGAFAGAERCRQFSTSIGYAANQGGVTGANDYSIGVGYSSESSGLSSIAIGQNALANKNYNIAIGSGNAQSIGTGGAIAIGYSAVASGTNSLSLGNAALANATNSTCLGSNGTAGAAGAIAIGYGADSSTANYCQIGQGTNSGTGARMKFRSQTLGDEAWIDFVNRVMVCDASGNLVKSSLNPDSLNAAGLTTATTTVNISSATAPSSGQVLTANSSTDASWQTPSTGIGLSTTDTLTNKTATGATNTLTARLVKTSTNEVDLSASAAPVVGYGLVASGAATAAWATIPIVPGICTPHRPQFLYSFDPFSATLSTSTMTPANFGTISSLSSGNIYRIVGHIHGSFSAAAVAKSLQIYDAVGGTATTARFYYDGVYSSLASITTAGTQIAASFPTDTGVFGCYVDCTIVTSTSTGLSFGVRMVCASGTASFTSVNCRLAMYKVS